MSSATSSRTNYIVYIVDPIGRIFIETIPQWLTIGAMLALIFGGCCSNVFALEAIIKVEPASGMCPSTFPPATECALCPLGQYQLD